LFSFAAQNSIIDSNIINIMVAVVALSMAMTPIVIVLNEKLILPRFGQKKKMNVNPTLLMKKILLSSQVSIDSEILLVAC